MKIDLTVSTVTLVAGLLLLTGGASSPSKTPLGDGPEGGLVARSELARRDGECGRRKPSERFGPSGAARRGAPSPRSRCPEGGLPTRERQALQLEEKLIATIPEGIELEGEPVRGPDGKLWPVVHRVQWSPKGRRVAYVGVRDGRTHPVIGERVLDAYHFLDAPVFSDDGEHVAFRAGNRLSEKRERWWVLLDGEETGAEDWIGAIRFLPDADELCYWTQPGARVASTGEYRGGSLVFVRGGKTGAKWDDAVALLPPVVSADGKVVASPARRGDAWYVMRFEARGERKIGRRDASFPRIAGIALSPDGDEVAVVSSDPRGGAPEVPDLPPGLAPPAGMMGGKLVVLRGNVAYGRDEEGAGQPRFSPDGRRLAYKLLVGEHMTIGIDGRRPLDRTFDFVHTPVWSPDSKRIAYAVTEGGTISPFWRLGPRGDGAVRGGRSRLVVHDRRGRRPERGEEFLELGVPVWGPEGERLAHAARTEEGWRIVCGDRRGPVYDEVAEPVFAPDGSRVGYGARSGRELWWRVLALE